MRFDHKKLLTAVLVCLGALVSATSAHAATFTIGGTVSGLTTGQSVTLLDNGGDSLAVSVNGKFTFKTALATGATYNVTVGTQPTGETCAVTAGSGTVGTINVTTVKVACKVPTYTIGGTLAGLITGRNITLLDNGASALKLAANGTFAFKTQLASGAKYSVTISIQPAGQTCTVTGGSGTVAKANVTTVAVSCTPLSYTIGGTLSGLITGRSVTLADNGTDTLTMTANGAFTFAKSVASGSAYKVTVKTQPAGQTCTVTGGAGKVVASNITVVVACVPKTYTIGGTVSGLSTGASVTLLDNGGNALTATANATFTFTTKVASGSTYSVTVGTQPTGETCTVTAGSGTVGTANVTSVKVACASSTTYSIGGTLSGLNSGASVKLLDNGADSLTLTANGAFTFATKLASGAKYAVTVGTQPTGETCTVTAGSGTVGTANVTTVAVACKAAATFSIGGTVSGLNSGTSVTLLNNGANSLSVTANGAFTFSTKLASGAAYSVTVGTQPTGETCTVTNGSGTVGTANVTNVAVACATAATFSIGGTVSGLNSGTSVMLLDNGANSLTVSANGSFTFTTKLASGAAYSVTVGTEPTGETCTVTNGSGTVGSANVTNVAVACSASTGGGGAYWIPYSATPIPNVTPAGKNGLFVIPSDKLSSAPAPTFVTTDNTQLLGIGTQITQSGGVLTYSPQVMMYADISSTGTTKIFGLTLAGTSTVPTPKQISNLSLTSSQQICSTSGSAMTDVSTPTTLFVVIEVGTSAQCIANTGTFEVVHYTDSSTTAPAVVSINTTIIRSVYQSGKLTALLVFDSTTSSFDSYTNNTFTSPTQLITGLTTVNDVRSILDANTLSTTGYFFSVTSTTAVNSLYRIDGATHAATQIQNLGTGTVADSRRDDTNLYYTVVTPGTSPKSTETFNQVALTGGTPKLLYTSTYGSTTAVESYQLIGSNDSVLAFAFSTIPLTNSIQDLTKATATIYTVPVGTTTTTPTTLSNYTAGNSLPQSYIFLAAPSGSGYSGNEVFATVQHSTGTPPLVTVAYSAVSIPLNGGAAPAPIANSVYAPLAVISNDLTDSPWQITGITDTNGGFGGGTANQVTVSNLTDTPFTTTGGGNYVFPAGYVGGLFSISSNNIALGFWDNAPAVEHGTATLQEQGAAADLSKSFLYVVSLTNTYVTPY